MSCYLQAIAHFLPLRLRTNADLIALNPSWNDDAIYRKTGIRARPIADPEQTAQDLGYLAIEELFRNEKIDRATVDVLIFVTESPDYLVPPSACILQHRLGLSPHAASFDVNLGCSGFVYGLMLARSLILSRTASRVLLVCAETYSRYCDPHDLATVTLFGDGAAAALISDERTGSLAEIGTSVLGTDGSGYQDLIVENGGARSPDSADLMRKSDPKKRILKMNGPEVFRFALDRVKPACEELLSRLGKTWNDVDVCLCHQANRFMLESLRTELNLPVEKLPIDVEQIGNLSTASLPVFISRWVAAENWRTARTTLAIGFGVGYSWGVAWLTWHVDD
jgi:3-oxoacyl-[acyl-carrier-protein] synthase-3